MDGDSFQRFPRNARRLRARQHRRRVGAVEKGVDGDVGTVFHKQRQKKKGLTELGNFNIEEDKNYILRNKVEMESHED